MHRSRHGYTATAIVVAQMLIVQSVAVQALKAQSDEPGPLIDPKLVKFYVADGRLSCIVKTRQNQRKTRESDWFPRQELTVDAGVSPSVRLLAEGAKKQRTEIEFHQGEVIVFLRAVREWELHQNQSGYWRVSTADGTETAYPSFWHLLLAEHELRTELIPVLELMRPHWEITNQLAETRRRLIKTNADVVGRDLVLRWVNELASSDFSARRNADKALRAYGQQIVPVLRQLDPMRLDAEQRRRIQRIIRASRTDCEDDVARMVNRFSGDLWVWCYFLKSDDQSVRELAHQRVATIVGNPVTFDSKAERDIRATQITRIERDWEIR